ncbi:hypothetical protein M1466_02605 [Candidatus Dependentiae bacterium]|nr:hypothetical protein [Candidatus Dependentiae bacterium]
MQRYVSMLLHFLVFPSIVATIVLLGTLVAPIPSIIIPAYQSVLNRTNDMLQARAYVAGYPLAQPAKQQSCYLRGLYWHKVTVGTVTLITATLVPIDAG